MKILILISIIGFSSGVFYENRPCPVRPIIPKFSVKKYAGKWYQLSKFSNAYERGHECSTTLVTATGNKTFDATNCEKINGIQDCNEFKLTHVGDEGIFLPIEVNGRSELKLKKILLRFKERKSFL